MTQIHGPLDLSGLRVLVVEDEFLIADTLVYLLKTWDCTVIGPASRLSNALAIAQNEKLDGALLDINLFGERSLEVAAALRRRGVPFVFVTGYDDTALSAEYRSYPRMSKPFEESELASLMAEEFKHRNV
jgi:DNA-binding LytR/AlgR family response regulator